MRTWRAAAARVGYLLVLAVATLSALQLDADPAAVTERLRRMLVPSISARDAIDGARNLVLFAGWGLVWVLTARRPRWWVTVAAATVTGAVLSLSVELVQAFSRTRRASILDLMTNSLGALAGALVAALALGLLARWRGRRMFVGVPALAFAGAYGAAVIGEMMVPLFRQEEVEGAWGGPVRRFAVTASRFEWATLGALPKIDLLLFLPAGVLAVAALAEYGVGYRRAAVWTAAVGVILALATEVAHAALGIPILAGAALVHAAALAGGAAAGAWLIPPFTRRWRGAGRPRVVAVAYAGAVLLWSLRPFRVQTDPEAIRANLAARWWMPLSALGMRMDPFSVVDVVNGFLLYVPLGALLAVWPLSRRGWLAGVLPALYVGAAAELAQPFVAGRTLDVTDLLVHVAGAAVGWVLVRRSGYTPYGTLTPATPRAGGGRSAPDARTAGRV